MPPSFADQEPVARTEATTDGLPTNADEGQRAEPPALIPSENRIPGVGLKSEIESQPTAASVADGPLPSERSDSFFPALAPTPPTIVGYVPTSLAPGCAEWGALRWTHPDSRPNGLVHLYTFELYRDSDDAMVWDQLFDYTLTGAGVVSDVAGDCESILPDPQATPIVELGESYYAKVYAWDGTGWSAPATSSAYPAVALPGLTDEAARGVCVCDTSTGRLYPLNILRADPVNTATGTLTESATDLTIPGVGPAISASRTYNSTDPTVGPLGKGWSFPYFSELESAASSVTYKAEDGQEVEYALQGGAYRLPPGASTRLRSVSGGYQLETKSHQVIGFDQNGRLEYARDSSGQGVSLAYATNGTLDKITDASGREVDVTMDASGKVTAIALSDGRSVSYGYTGDLLTSVTDVRGGVTEYEYDAAGRLAAITDPLGNEVMRSTYDAQGRVISQVDAGGGTWGFEYVDDGAYQTTRTTDPRGGVSRDVYYNNVLVESETAGGAITTYQYDERLRLAATVDPHGRTTRHTYDANDNLLSTTHPNGDREAFTYSSGGDLLTETSPEGRKTTYTYDANHRVATTTDPNGGVTSYTYNTDGQVLTETSPEGNVTEFEYDAQGNRVATISPEGRRTTATFDAYGRLESQTTARGHVAGADPADFTTTFAYDVASNLTSSTDPLGHVTEYEYDLNNRRTTVIDPLDRRTETEFDAAGRVVKIIEPGGAETVHEYDLAGNQVATTDAEGGRTTRTFDLDAHMITMTAARGNEPGAEPADFTWGYEYDGLGNVVEETDSAGGIVSYGYDERYRQTSVTNQANETTTTAYDGDGNTVSVTDPLDRTVSTTYNGLNLPATVTDPAGKVSTVIYDRDGNRTSTTTPLGHKATFTYDGDGMLVQDQTPNGNGRISTYTYDADGNQIRTVDPQGRFTTATFDNAGRVSSRSLWNVTTTYGYDDAGRLTTVTGGDGAVTEYGYNTAGDLVTVTDPNDHVTTHTYDDAHRRTATTDALNRTRTFGYDADGNQTSTVLARGPASGDLARWTVTQSYDELGRRTGVTTGSTASTASYAYDPVGRLTGVTDAGGTTTTVYDDAGQIASVTRGSQAYGYTYDPRGMVKTITQPGGVTVTNTFDDDGRLATTASTNAGTTAFSYDKNNNLTRIDNLAATGLVNRWQQRNYDRADALVSTTTGTGTTTDPTQTVTYSRDGAGRPFVIRRGAGGTQAPGEAHFFDAAGRLAQVCYDASSMFGQNCATADETLAYTYDGAGNRLTETRTGGTTPGTTTYTYDAANQLTQRGNTTYSYDADGNQISDGATSWTYDELNRLVGIDTPTADSQLTYDGLGNRTSVTTGATTRTFSWDINNPLPLLTSVTQGTSTTRYRYGPDAIPVNANINGTNHALLTEDLNSLTTTYNRTTGAKSWTTTYEPFGTPRNTTSTGLTTAQVGLGYTGEYLDPTTGLLNLRARNYNPTLGQFTSTDPVETPQGTPSISPYAYVDNRPTVLTDPSGACFFIDMPWIPGCSEPSWADEVTPATNGVLAGLISAAEDTFYLTGMALGVDWVGYDGDLAQQLFDEAAVEGNYHGETYQQAQLVGGLVALVGGAASTAASLARICTSLVRKIRPPVASGGLATEVPAYAGSRTAGTLVTPDGAEFPLISGWHPPAASMPQGTPGMNIVTKSHVEAHAAAIMRNQGLSEATLWINRAPCGGKPGCAAMLPRMVPSGSTLTINVVPNGSAGSIADTLIIRGIG
ncbi:DUF6531 domain-containing protein [Jiangella alba]|nr:DUF6531 domain-containing protein [Jiangella alba]